MAWDVVYYRAADKSIPAAEFLDSCPTKVEAEMLATLEGGYLAVWRTAQE